MPVEPIRTYTSARSFCISILLVAGLLVGLLQAGCATCSQCSENGTGDPTTPNDPGGGSEDPTEPTPPTITVSAEQGLGRRTLIGNPAFIEVKASERVRWTVRERPAGWRITSQSDDSMRLEGTIPPGASVTTPKIIVIATALDDEQESEPFEGSFPGTALWVRNCTLSPRIDNGITYSHTVTVSGAPFWPAGHQARVKVYVDTSGLSTTFNDDGTPKRKDGITISHEGVQLDRKDMLGPCTSENATLNDAGPQNEILTMSGNEGENVFVNGRRTFGLTIIDWGVPDGDPSKCSAPSTVHSVDLKFE